MKRSTKTRTRLDKAMDKLAAENLAFIQSKMGEPINHTTLRDYKITLKDGTAMTVRSNSYFEAIADARVSTSDIANCQEVMDEHKNDETGSGCSNGDV